MSDLRTYLASLDKPAILEEIDFEAILAARKIELVAAMQAAGIDYSVEMLETDTAVIQLQEASYEEVLLRARGNDIARARYLFFARESEIDHLGAFYDCDRMSGESDERYLTRIILAIQGRSTGGTAPRYRRIALEASLQVADAIVYVVDPDPTVNVAVYSTDPTGVADAGLLATVRAALNAADVRMVNDTLAVRSAVVHVVDITADVWLLPDAAETIIANAESDLAGAWISESGLGQDLVVPWLVARLMVSGMQKVVVTSPTADVVADPWQAIRLGSVTLNNRGRAW